MSTPYQAPSPYGSQPTRRRIWPWVLSGCAIAGVLTVAACGGLLYFGYRQVAGSGDVAVEVDRLFEEIGQGRAAEFYRTRTTAEFKRVSSEGEFVTLAESLREQLGTLESKSVSGFHMSTNTDGTYVDATYDCQFQHGKGTLKVYFQRENDQWMLNGFHIDSPQLSKPAATAKCPHCGETYEAGAKFCPHCGKEIADSQSVAEP